MKTKLFLTIIIVFAFFVSMISPAVYSETPTPVESETTPTPTPDNTSQKVNDLNNKITELENKLNDLRSTEKTLNSQIEVVDNQIALTELRINATESEIEELTGDIDIATEKVENLEGRIGKISQALLNRIVSTYKAGSIAQSPLFVNADTFTDYFMKMNYLKIIQARDRELLYDTHQAQLDYENQKDIYEEKKNKVVALQAQLEEYKAQIDQEKKSKEELLRITQNSEEEYQKQLAAAKAERAAIEGVVSSLKLENGTPVKEGQSIASVGNSGYPDCSTGDHLHFEVRLNGSIVDPAGYLKSGAGWTYNYSSDYYSFYGTINPRGDWNWPLYETIEINQAYGSHGYSSRYPGGIHTGIDMESSASSIIKSPKDGTLYRGTTACGRSALNYVAVDHGDGVISWYWHVK